MSIHRFLIVAVGGVVLAWWGIKSRAILRTSYGLALIVADCLAMLLKLTGAA